MALLHAATLTPSKAELIEGWLPTQGWAPAADGPIELVGAFRFDDPDGKVGLEVHLVCRGGVLLQVPLTYRDAPLEGGEGHLAGTMQHSALGERWVYDGLGDPVFTRMLAAVALTGCGQAVGLAEHEGRWYVVPPQVRLSGGGWTDERVPVDGLVAEGEPDADGWAVLRSDRFELRVARRPLPGTRPPIGLTATWAGQGEPVVLAEALALAR
jgi:hypothetical protein